MKHTNSESDVTSLAPSSPPRSPKRPPTYYVQSPSRDSHDENGYKSSSMQDTPVFNSPNESPTHPSSFGPHSRTSSLSRFSGNIRKIGGGERKGLNEKGWPECNVIEEEGNYNELDGDKEFTTRCRIFLIFLGIVLFFACICLILWGAARPLKADIVVKSLAVGNFYIGEGTDNSGVPTKMATVNCSLLLNVYNPAGMFGIHVTSSPVSLLFSQISVADGQLKKYYQPRNSHRTVSINLQGQKVPLYGAGAGLSSSSTSGSVPLTLDFDIISRGYVVGQLVKVTHKKHVSCHLNIDAKKTKPIKFSKSSCSYE